MEKGEEVVALDGVASAVVNLYGHYERCRCAQRFGERQRASAMSFSHCCVRVDPMGLFEVDRGRVAGDGAVGHVDAELLDAVEVNHHTVAKIDSEAIA